MGFEALSPKPARCCNDDAQGEVASSATSRLTRPQLNYNAGVKSRDSGT